ncbi:glycosyltransferase [Pseudomonas gingeri]|uniref:glycosyltransferase n=1 Tax=Pseudomonas gingeri TaxID=117681 RepID=UPI00159FB9E8|nr:glycosyltransferase [Pseudomonas gingeri]NWD77183.1 glycosyltransferase [Pseudomonas gingeri]
MEQIDRLLERMDKLTCAVERKSGESAQLLRDIESRNQAIDQLCAEKKRLKDGLSTRTSELGRLAGQMRHNRQQMQAMSQKLKETEARLQEQKAAAQTLSEQVAQLHQQLTSKQTELLNLSDWATTMDRAPLRHLVRKILFHSARYVYTHLPLAPSQKHRLAHRARRWLKGAGVATTQNQPLSTLMTMPADSIEAAFSEKQNATFIFAVIDWHFRIQRPQNLAKELARTGQVTFYISNHFIDNDRPGFEVEPLEGVSGLFQIRLNVSGAPAIYHAPPTSAAIKQLRLSLAELMQWANTGTVHCIVQHAYWFPLARCVPNSTLIYDCMDHHEGFGNVAQELLDLEKALMRRADLLVATSTWIEQHGKRENPNVSVIRNAAEYSAFCQAPEQIYRDAKNRKIIGYYGAIAEWFDLQLVKQLAQALPQHLVLLIGNDTVNAKKHFKDCPNIVMHGEVPYASLPYYLHAMDVCLLPFKVIPLTLATNPVKVYEYLSAGKPVVSVKLPELDQFGSLANTAENPTEFIAAVQGILEQLPEPESASQARQQFAKTQTWKHRAIALRQAIDSLPVPKVSVVVLTYNNLELTKACLDSLVNESDYANLEIVVVDNHSTDDTPAFLAEWAEAGPDRIIILNQDNKGFAAGNNQGLAAAGGDYLVVLNNDTIVTAGWIKGLMRHLIDNDDIGIIGPVTNNIGNEARITTRYSHLATMHAEATSITRKHMGQWFEINTLAFFCVMIPRSCYEQIGGLCEDYGLGFFEDDDYCRRVQHQGLRAACAEDVFVHHHLSASFNKLGAEKKQALFEKNKAIYERKWGAWTPHRYREA